MDTSAEFEIIRDIK